MRKFETLLALFAVVLASMAALQIPGRLVFALAAIMILVYIGSSRLRAMVNEKKTVRPTFDPAERARQIHEARSNRFDR